MSRDKLFYVTHLNSAAVHRYSEILRIVRHSQKFVLARSDRSGLRQLALSIQTDVYKYTYIAVYLCIYDSFCCFSDVASRWRRQRRGSAPKFEFAIRESTARYIPACEYARHVSSHEWMREYTVSHEFICTRSVPVTLCQVLRIIIAKTRLSDERGCRTDLSSSFSHQLPSGGCREIGIRRPAVGAVNGGWGQLRIRRRGEGGIGKIIEGGTSGSF